MGLRQMIVMLFLTGCICLPVRAQQVDSVIFNNSDGMFSGSGLTSGSLSLNNSTLIQISGFTGLLTGFDTTGANLGNLNFTTGLLSAGGSMGLWAGKRPHLAPAVPLTSLTPSMAASLSPARSPARVGPASVPANWFPVKQINGREPGSSMECSPTWY